MLQQLIFSEILFTTIVYNLNNLNNLNNLEDIENINNSIQNSFRLIQTHSNSFKLIKTH